MKTFLAITGFLVVVVAAYFLLWPVPVTPAHWQAPESHGYVDPFEMNDSLIAATSIDLGTFEGPEDATLGTDGRLYATTHSGILIRIQDRAVSHFADVGGRPLGIQTDKDGSFVVANAYLGLQRVTRDGVVSTILSEVDGQALVYADGLDIGQNGTIYFSEASSKFGAEEFGGTYPASLLDILEHGGHGSIYAYNPATETVVTLLSNLNFANGVAISADNSFILISETGSYRILKYWLSGARAGTSEVIVDNLPGFPDNIKRGTDDHFWVGLISPRNPTLDGLSDKPFVRKLVQRLPASMRPAAVPSSHVIAINGDGDILMNLYDPNSRFPALTGVVETRDALYLTTLFGHQLPRLAKRDL